MRFFIGFLIIILISSSCKEKEQEEADIGNVKNLITSYYDAFSKRDWPSVISFVHPEVFTYISRTEFENQLEKTLKGTDFEIKINKIVIDSISPVIYKGVYKYSFVSLRTISDMFLADS